MAVVETNPRRCVHGSSIFAMAHKQPCTVLVCEPPPPLGGMKLNLSCSSIAHADILGS